MAVTGTFSGAGQSATVSAPNMRILMDFAGTASVNVEMQGHDDEWVVVDTLTADHHVLFANPLQSPVRLNCTAHTNNVVYSLTPYD